MQPLFAVSLLFLSFSISDFLVTARPSLTDTRKWDAFCAAKVRPGSYCKYWHSTRVCQGSDVACGNDEVAPTTTSTTPPPSSSVAPTAIDPSDDPCSFHDALFVEKATSAGDKYYTDMSRMWNCIDRTVVTNANALWTLHNLLYGLVEVYSFTGIAKDSAASDHETECSFRVHEVKVDIESVIKKKINAYNRQMRTMSAKERTEFLQMTIPAYPFHSELTRLIDRLHDAHTLYYSAVDMFSVYSPIQFGSRMQNGKQVVTLRFDEPGRMSLFARTYEAVFQKPAVPAERVGAIVTHVDGVDALEWLLMQVSDDGPNNGHYQGAHQRLNGAFFSASSLIYSSMTGNVPKSEGLSLRFEDGAEIFVKHLFAFLDRTTAPDVMHSGSSVPSLTSTETLNDYCNTNPAFDTYMLYEKDFMSETKPDFMWQTVTAIAGKGVSTHNAFKHFQGSKATSLIPVAGNMKDSFDDYVAGALSDISGSDSTDSDGFVSFGYMSYRIQGDTVVVRLPGFSGMDFRTQVLLPEFVEIYEAAKAQGVSKILWDLSKNGGGYVKAAYAAQWFMIPPEQVCAPLQKRMTWNWKVWQQSFGPGMDSIAESLVDRNGIEYMGGKEFVDTQVSQLKSLVQMMFDALQTPSAPVFGLDDVAAFTAELDKFETATAGNISPESRFAEMMKLFKWVQKTFDEESIEDQTWFPLSAMNPPVWGEAGGFDPPQKPYTDLVTRKWGSEYGQYTMPAEFGFCQATMHEMDLRFGAVYNRDYWTEVAFMTDGTCGSACSMFTQQLQLSGRATAFTFGGVADTVVDVSSFAGGNVLEYDNYWPLVTASAKLANLLTFGQSEWGKLNAHSWVSSPVPFPSRASARFNWNMMSSKHMGPKALPRQWYIIPGHQHINVWAHNQAGREAVYEEVLMRDWCQSKQNAQFAATHGQCLTELSCGPLAVANPFSREADTKKWLAALPSAERDEICSFPSANSLFVL